MDPTNPTNDTVEEKQEKPKGQPLPVAEREILAKRIHALLLVDPNRPAVAIAKELGISRFQVKRIVDSEYFRKMLEERSDADMQVAITQAKHAMSRCLHEAVRVIKHHLDKNSLDAAKMVLRSQGLEQMEERPTDTSITVVLPTGINQGKVFEVKQDGTPAEDGSDGSV